MAHGQHCRSLSRRQWLGLFGVGIVGIAGQPGTPAGRPGQDRAPGASGPPTTEFDGLWRVVSLRLESGLSHDASGLCAVRDGRLTLVVMSPDTAGPALATAGALQSPGSSWTLTSQLGGVRTEATARLAAWSADRLDISRDDVSVTLTLDGHVVRAVRTGLGIGQRAQLAGGVLTLADDRFLLVTKSSDGHRWGFGSFYRREAVYTLSPERWLAETPRGVSLSVPGPFDVDATAANLRFPDGGDTGVVEPLSRRPPRAPRSAGRSRQSPGRNRPQPR